MKLHRIDWTAVYRSKAYREQARQAGVNLASFTFVHLTMNHRPLIQSGDNKGEAKTDKKLWRDLKRHIRKEFDAIPVCIRLVGDSHEDIKRIYERDFPLHLVLRKDQDNCQVVESLCKINPYDFDVLEGDYTPRYLEDHPKQVDIRALVVSFGLLDYDLLLSCWSRIAKHGSASVSIYRHEEEYQAPPVRRKISIEELTGSPVGGSCSASKEVCTEQPKRKPIPLPAALMGSKTLEIVTGVFACRNEADALHNKALANFVDDQDLLKPLRDKARARLMYEQSRLSQIRKRSALPRHTERH
jgi:hypothetical protein